MLEIETPPNILAETLRERIIVLHALWRIGAERGVEKYVYVAFLMDYSLQADRMDSISAKLDQLVHDDFNLLVSDRKLLEDTIAQIVVLSEGAFYKHRMIRPKTDRRPPANTSVLLDWRIIRHIYDLHSTLLNVGTAELAVPPPSDVDVGENSLALKITATFRRTLPGLRIASKWLRANNGTLMKDPEFVAFCEEERSRGNEVTKENSDKISGNSTRTIEFWTRYVEFISALAEAFPQSSLPTLTSPLDEDVDMRGYLPLKKLMDEEITTDGQGSPQVREKPHPNAEQLMRIFDLLGDARILAELPVSVHHISFIHQRVLIATVLKNSLVKLEGNSIVLNSEMIEGARPGTRLEAGIENEDDYEDLVEDTSSKEGDVIEEAFREGALDQEFDDDDEEQIVYPR
jgi:hypothetical protein